MKFYTPFRYLLAALLLSLGFYLLRAFELCAKVVAAMSLLPGNGRILPEPLEGWLLLCQAAALTACFAPAIWLSLRPLLARWKRSPNSWAVCGVCIVLFGAAQYAQQRAYLQIRAALPLSDPHASACPRFSVSSLSNWMNKILFIPPELVSDSDNEQCVMLKLAHDTDNGMDEDWDVFKLKAYDPRLVPAHYSENTIFPLAAAVSKALRASERISPTRLRALALTDQARIASNGLDAIHFVLGQQGRSVKDIQVGSNPLARIAARVRAWEEASLLVGFKSLLATEKARLEASAQAR